MDYPLFLSPILTRRETISFFNAEFIVENELGWLQREGDNLNNTLMQVIKEPLKQKSEKLLSYTVKDVAQTMIKDVKSFLRK